MTEYKPEKQICWLSMASGKPVYCMKDECIAWTGKTAKPICKLLAINAISYNFMKVSMAIFKHLNLPWHLPTGKGPEE